MYPLFFVKIGTECVSSDPRNKDGFLAIKMNKMAKVPELRYFKQYVI